MQEGRYGESCVQALLRTALNVENGATIQKLNMLRRPIRDLFPTEMERVCSK
jgi:hypothetical protein